MVTRRSANCMVKCAERVIKHALLEHCGLPSIQAEDRLQRELNYYRELNLATHSLDRIFKRFCISLANRRGLLKLVFGGPEDFNRIVGAYRDGPLYAYAPQDICHHYHGDRMMLLNALLHARELNPEQEAHQFDHPQSGFHRYADGILAGAAYFAGFPAAESFHEFVGMWLHHPDMTTMLPEYFGALGIPGFRSALAADFLKEIGVKELGKPDIWVRRTMACIHWIEHEDDPPVNVQRAFRAASNHLHHLRPSYPPAVIDKLMYLVGTGNLGMVKPVYNCGGTFDAFCACFDQCMERA